MISIYKITNSFNGKMYVGQTNQPIERRFLQHSKTDSPLGQAMRDIGLENFTIEVVEEVTFVEQARRRERFWIRVLKSKVPNGYNRSNGGESPASDNPNPKKKSSDAMAIAESLKRFRKDFNLNQKTVARLVGITPQTYHGYEAGTSAPSATVIKKSRRRLKFRQTTC